MHASEDLCVSLLTLLNIVVQHQRLCHQSLFAFPKSCSWLRCSRSKTFSLYVVWLRFETVFLETSPLDIGTRTASRLRDKSSQSTSAEANR